MRRSKEIEELRSSRLATLTKLSDALTDAHGFALMTVIDSSVADTIVDNEVDSMKCDE